MSTGEWFPKTNYHIIATLRKVCGAVSKGQMIKLHWAKGHSKVLGNELAGRAADRGRSTILPTGGRYTIPCIPVMDLARVIATGSPSVSWAELSSLQNVISSAAGSFRPYRPSFKETMHNADYAGPRGPRRQGQTPGKDRARRLDPKAHQEVFKKRQRRPH